MGKAVRGCLSTWGFSVSETVAKWGESQSVNPPDWLLGLYPQPILMRRLLVHPGRAVALANLVSIRVDAF